LVDAAQRLDAAVVVATVGGHLAEHGVVATWQQLCRPALAVLDRRVTETGGCIDAQLVMTWGISTALRSLTLPGNAAARRANGAAVLLACTEGEQHTLALEALHAALGEAAVPARMLGPSVPDVALVEACRRTGPGTVVLWAQTPQTARPEVLDQLGSTAGSILALGPGWVGLELADLPDTVDTLDDLPTAVGRIAEQCDAGRLAL
jgi:hypothetical protein